MISKAVKKVVFASFAMLGALEGVHGMYESDKGKNDWHIETLGEISDMILYADHKSYTLSTDGLLTMFDTTTQTMLWKKQMSQAQFGEQYRLRHVSKNVLVYSDERATMFGANGQIAFEEPLEGEGHSVVEMWREGDSFYSCFVRGNIVTVYKAHNQIAQFRINDALSLELPAEFSNVFEHLELIHTGGKLLLTTKIGTNADNNNGMIAVFELDHSTGKAE